VNLVSFGAMKAHGTQLSLFEMRSSTEPFAVRISPRARRLTARVHVGGRVEIVVPVGVNAHAVRDFVQRFTPWINRKVAAMRSYVAPAEPVPRLIEFAYTREQLAVEWRRGVARRPEQQADRLVLQAPDDASARGLLQAWLKVAAEQRLAPRLLQLADELNYSVARVTIRCQRTRWGSCSTRGTVSLNCSLVFLRPEVVRYLFIHELAHTKHMNHSANFWRLVEKLEPDYRQLDRELLAGWRTVPAWVFKT
jgi:predicted metal-dependent hydrolase